jgi:aspartokinase-like uncharacterized kinase
MLRSSPVVVKIGGSLYDLPDLGPRLRAWLASQAGAMILVPGGGPMVEALRQLDRIHHLGEEACHWLALRTLTINAQFLAQLLPGSVIIRDPEHAARASVDPGQRPRGAVTIMDMYPFAVADEANPGRLPHGWDVTSDSLAVRVAIVAQARRLVLLKSAGLPGGFDPQGALGFPGNTVDHHFHEALRQAPDLQVELVNFRAGAEHPR